MEQTYVDPRCCSGFVFDLERDLLEEEEEEVVDEERVRL